MKLNKWEEYNNEEKSNLLMHYFTYFGKTFITLDELEKYHELCKSDPDLVFNYVIFATNKGPTSLVYLIRNNTYMNALNSLKEVIDRVKKEKRELYDEIENGILSVIVSTYNEPEPSIPFTDEQIIEEAKKLKFDK